jgi:hypothetical protein
MSFEPERRFRSNGAMERSADAAIVLAPECLAGSSIRSVYAYFCRIVVSIAGAFVPAQQGFFRRLVYVRSV